MNRYRTVWIRPVFKDEYEITAWEWILTDDGRTLEAGTEATIKEARDAGEKRKGELFGAKAE